MQELLVQVLGYLWGIWRYRWQGLALAFVVSLAGWVWVYQLPEKYQASARIHVDTNTVLRPLLRGLAIQPAIGQRIKLMTRTLLSRPNLEKLMRMTDLDLQAQSDAQKEEILDTIKSNVKLAGSDRNSSLYSIAYQSEDREMSIRMVQSLITVFIESTLGGERADSADAQKFLDQQIEDYELRLSEAESRLAKFKQRYVGILPGQGGDYYNKLSQARQALESAKLQLTEITHRRDELKRQIEGEEPFMMSAGGDDSYRSPIDSRLHSLRSRLDALLTRYTDAYPEVVQIRRLIESLEEEREQQIEQAKSGESADYAGLKDSPVYQQMRTMLAESEARVAEMKVRVNEYQARADELAQMVDNIPVIEAELKQLNRDYKVVQQRHSELLSRRESALISQDVEQKSNDLVFRVVDPPFAPQNPNEPNKVMLNALVLLVGLGAGGGLALLLALLNPVVIDRFSLNHVSGLPVLGTVSLVSDKDRDRKALVARIAFFGVALCLPLAFAAITAFQLGVLL